MTSEEATPLAPHDQIPRETLDFLYEVIVPGPERQLATQENLDAKVAQVFAAAAVVLGLASVVITREHIPDGAVGFLVAAGVSFLATALISVYHLRPLEFHATRHADLLWNEYWSDPVPLIKYAMAENASKSYAINRNLLNKKARTLRTVLVLAGMEASFVGAAVVWVAVS